MGCDYYIQSEIVIEYFDKNGNLCIMVTKRNVNKQYLGSSINYDSDDDMETQYDKYNSKIQKEIKENTYNKDLYIDDTWVCDSYRKKYENDITHLLKIYGPYKLKRVYKNYTAWERN